MVKAKKKPAKLSRRALQFERLMANATESEREALRSLEYAAQLLNDGKDVDDVLAEIEAAVMQLGEARGLRNAACDIKEGSI